MVCNLIVVYRKTFQWQRRFKCCTLNYPRFFPKAVVGADSCGKSSLLWSALQRIWRGLWLKTLCCKAVSWRGEGLSINDVIFLKNSSLNHNFWWFDGSSQNRISLFRRFLTFFKYMALMLLTQQIMLGESTNSTDLHTMWSILQPRRKDLSFKEVLICIREHFRGKSAHEWQGGGISVWTY